tara:strand:- start:11847 stop:12062 length:216 start_codon:yes stop_codon:yes gene_type:complete
VRASAAERREVFGLFNVSEAARQLGVGIQRFHRDIRAGRVQSPQVRVGRRLYFAQKDLRDLSTQYKKGQAG